MYVSVKRRTSLMSSSLLLPQRSACVVRLIWMVLEMGSKCQYSYCFVECCYQDLFNLACCILGQFPSTFYSIRLVSVHLVHPYSRIDKTTAWKRLRFILSDRYDFHMIDNLLIAIHAFTSRILMSFQWMRCFRSLWTCSLRKLPLLLYKSDVYWWD